LRNNNPVPVIRVYAVTRNGNGNKGVSVWCDKVQKGLKVMSCLLTA